MSKFKNNFTGFILLAVLCGLAAGVLGEIVTRVYLLKDFSFPYLGNEVNLADFNSNRSNLIIRDAKKVVVNQDLKVNETVASIRPALVSVFKQVSATTTETAKPSYYKLDEPLFIGLAITSDGWIMASLPTEMKANFNSRNYIVITSDRRLYKIDQMAATKYLPGDLIFFHLAGAANLAVKRMVPRAELAAGQAVLVINGFNKAVLTSLTSFKKTPAVLNSDALSARLTLAAGEQADFKNSFVFNLAGDLVAVIDADQAAIPAFSYNSYGQGFLKKTAPSRPSLGVNYLDLSAAKVLTTALDKGALLYPTATDAAVLKNSPAALAGLKAGDVITWVDNQEINALSDLADIISTYQAGDKIIVTYSRAGQEAEVEIKLGELK